MLSRLNSSSGLDAASYDPSSAAAAAILDVPTSFLSSGGGGAHFADPFSYMTVGPTANTSASSFDSFAPMPSSDLMFSGFGFGSGLHGFNPMSLDTFEPHSQVLRPLEVSPPIGAPPTLFQKRAARLKGISEEEFEDIRSIDGSGLNYSSDEAAPDQEEDPVQGGKATGGGEGSNIKCGKKKGLPAKNLMAERRRRKKLKDGLYLLRSVVPKISKMDRASILGDAIEYLKELLQRINVLRNELDSTPSSSSLPTPTASSFHPLTPTQPTLASPTGQPRVEVRVREGGAVNIHMFCARRPGLLLSTMRALDNLGLDVQQAVFSGFNGFALDVFRAQELKDGPGALPEEIKAALLHSAGFQNAR